MTCASAARAGSAASSNAQAAVRTAAYIRPLCAETGDRTSDGFGKRPPVRAAGSRTRNVPPRRSKKYPGWTSTPASRHQLGRPRFVAADRGHPHDGRPAGFGRQQRAARSRRQSPRELAAVGRDPRRDRGADARAQREQLGQRLLHRRRPPTGSVSAISSSPASVASVSRSTDDDPAELQVRQTARLRQPAQAEDAGGGRQRRRDRGGRDTRRDPAPSGYGANTSSATIASSAARRDRRRGERPRRASRTRRSGCWDSRRRWRASARRARAPRRSACSTLAKSKPQTPSNVSR